ncbi:MAG: hypothetical protein QXT62_02785 [Thermoplasmata archaeon]
MTEKNRKAKIFYILFGSLLSVSLVLTAAYITNLVYMIGDYPEIIPLLIGIIAGAIVFSIAGAFLNEKKYMNIVYTAIFSVAIILISDLILNIYAFANPDSVIMISGFLINSPYAVVVEISNYLSKTERLKNKLIASIIIAVLAIIIIVIFAIIYEKAGQAILPQGISIFAYLMLIAFIAILIMSRRQKIDQKS